MKIYLQRNACEYSINSLRFVPIILELMSTLKSWRSDHSFSVFSKLFALLTSSHTVTNQNQGCAVCKIFPK